MIERLKRIGILGIVTVMCLTVVGAQALAGSFTDVTNPRVAEAAELLEALEVVKGYGDGTLRPYEAISRAQAAAFVVRALGLEDMAGFFNSGKPFTDTPGGQWYSGYTMVAANKGILTGYPDGSFRPNDSVTYNQMLAIITRALGYEQRAQSLGGWPIGYLQVAFELGLTSQLGSFNPDAPALRGDVVLMLKGAIYDAKTATGETLAYDVLDATPPVSRIDITSSVDRLKKGGKAYLTATVYDTDGLELDDASVEWSTDIGLISQNGLYYGTDAGMATITASYGGISVEYTIAVAGQPVAIEIEGPEEIISNGVSEYTLTARVVDSNGVPVTDYEGDLMIQYAAGGQKGATTIVSSTLVETDDGAADFKIVANAGNFETDTLKVTATGLTAGTIEVTAVEQQPAAIKIVADAEQLSVNEATETTVRAYIIDQAGINVVHGTYEVTFRVTGDGELVTGTDGTWISYYIGNTFNPEASAIVSSLKGMYGSMTVIAEGEGLAPGRLTIPTVIAGAPKNLVVSLDKSTVEAGDVPFSGDDATVQVTVKVVDSAGTPVTAGKDMFLSLTYSDELDGKVHTNPGPMSIFLSRHDKSTTFEMSVETAGTWQFTVQDEDKDLPAQSFTARVIASDPQQLTVTPWDVTGDGFLQWDDTVLIGSSPIYITAAMSDSFGNPVAGSGGRVKFHATRVSGAGTGYINGSAEDVIRSVNSNGEAVVNFSATMYDGDRYQVEASYDADGDGYFTEGVADSAYLMVTDTVPYRIELTAKNQSNQQVSSITVDPGAWLNIEAKVLDSNGVAVPDAIVHFTVSEPTATIDASFTTSGSGTAYAAFTPGKAGTTQITAKVVNTASDNIAATKSIRVYAGAPTHVTLFGPDGTSNPITYDDPGVYGPYYLRVTDAAGNAAPAPEDIVLTDTDLDALFGANHTYRLDKTGLTVDQVTIKQYNSSGIAVWVAMSSAGTIDPGQIPLP